MLMATTALSVEAIISEQYDHRFKPLEDCYGWVSAMIRFARGAQLIVTWITVFLPCGVEHACSVKIPVIY